MKGFIIIAVVVASSSGYCSPCEPPATPACRAARCWTVPQKRGREQAQAANEKDDQSDYLTPLSARTVREASQTARGRT
jgi:hypothetical protein